MGTPSYMAPEQAEGHSKQVGPSADVYALGAILYHALTGRPPFLGESAMETLKLVTSTEAVPPRRLRPDVPRDLETIGLKCLEKEPPKRYASALALAEDLRRFLDGRTIAARPVGPVGRLWRWSRRNPKLAGLAATLFLTFAVGSPILLGLWLRARADRARAESEAAISKAVNEFLLVDLLGQASAYNQARLGTKPDPDLKVRTTLDRASAKIGDRFASQPLVEASIRQTVGTTYRLLGLYPQARPHLERSLELRRSALGAEDPETFLAMQSLGKLFMDDEKLKDAEPHLVQAMDGLRKTRGAGHPEALVAMLNVGELYQAQYKLSEAETLLVRALEGLRLTRGEESLEVFETMMPLAFTYQLQKRLDEAKATLEKVIDGLERTVGSEHPLTLVARENLATIDRDLDQPVEAERLLSEVLRVQRRTLGKQHPDTLHTMVNLAYLYMQLKDLDNAEILAKEALAGCRAALDRNSEATDLALAVLSFVYSQRQDLDKVESLLMESLEITRTRHGPDHAATAAGNHAAGKFLLARREFVKAEPYLRASLAYDDKATPDQSIRFVAESRLGASLLGQKKYDEAETLLLSAFTGLKARQEGVPLEFKSNLGGTMEQLIQLYDAWGKKVKAQEWRQELADLVLADPFAPS
jgi:tetratricopeptide (TPR) repeat protein